MGNKKCLFNLPSIAQLVKALYLSSAKRAEIQISAPYIVELKKKIVFYLLEEFSYQKGVT